MERLNIQITVNPSLYLKNPDSTDLGRKIISESIELINELGFESFTFKKLGERINSPESSIYRYFENKHILLIYLTSWYWSWLEYRIVLKTMNIPSSIEKLKTALEILTQPVEIDQSISYINEATLADIIITESSKAYHTKRVDEENSKGYFSVYKRIVERVGSIILEINDQYQYPHMLVSTVIEGANQQRFFAQHLPLLTDTDVEKDFVSEFYKQLVFNSVLKKYENEAIEK